MYIYRIGRKFSVESKKFSFFFLSFVTPYKKGWLYETGSRVEAIKLDECDWSFRFLFHETHRQTNKQIISLE